RGRHAIVGYTPMVAMPYILVDIVLARLALIFFCITSAALVSTCPFANAYLPARLGNRTGFAFLTHGLLLSALSIVGLVIVTKFSRVRMYSPLIADVFFTISVINSVVLTCRFMDKRYFRSTPRLQRWLVIATVSFVVSVVPVIAIVTVVVGLFVIR